MHIFISGPRNIGKSTLVRRTVGRLTDHFELKPGGFSTYPGLGNDLDIYMSPYCEIRKYNDLHRIAKRNLHKVVGIPEVFNTLGVSILHNSQEYADLICMDELGFLENDALQFQTAVVECLNGNIPILGVIKEVYVPWYDIIKNHPKVELISITLENRNTLIDKIVQKIMVSLQKNI